jgi:NADPH:quinone reductase-like Zn-dependent oxidoreductase
LFVAAGVDVVFDPVGGQALFESLKCVAWGAQYLVIGFAAGDIPKVGCSVLADGLPYNALFESQQPRLFSKPAVAAAAAVPVPLVRMRWV